MSGTRSTTYGRIALWGCFDTSDEADVMVARALLLELRRRQPRARFVALAEHPAHTHAQHGIEAWASPSVRRFPFPRHRPGFDVLVVASPDPPGGSDALAKLRALCARTGTRLDEIEDLLLAAQLCPRAPGPECDALGWRPVVGVDPGTQTLPQLVDLVAWLLLERYPVRLVASCASERERCGEVEACLRGEGVLGADQTLCTDAGPAETFAGCDLVVAVRYHCMLLAALLRIPVLGLCRRREEHALLASLGQARHALDVAELRTPRLVDEFCLLRATAQDARDALGARLADRRKALQERLDHLYGPVVAA